MPFRLPRRRRSAGQQVTTASRSKSRRLRRPKPTQGYRPRWADPNAKPPEPGIENDPTPFDPADVDANSDTLNNNLSPINPD